MLFVAVHESATSELPQPMSAFGGKADISGLFRNVQLSDADRCHDSFGEYFFRFGVTLGNALFVRVTQELLESWYDETKKRLDEKMS